MIFLSTKHILRIRISTSVAKVSLAAVGGAAQGFAGTADNVLLPIEHIERSRKSNSKSRKGNVRRITHVFPVKNGKNIKNKDTLIPSPTGFQVFADSLPHKTDLIIDHTIEKALNKMLACLLAHCVKKYVLQQPTFQLAPNQQ
uniref:Uncharacterized protein n=1 Tax=Glossina austeni TaxID=7395 RepID=A0A1A9UI19_GLOAU